MPESVAKIEESRIIKWILRELRRHRSNAIAQAPQPAKDRLVITTNGQPATWLLSSIPASSSLGSSVNLSLNGQELDEATDYSIDYTTGVVTFSSGQQALFKATPTPADVLTADYWTTGDLIAYSGTVDTGPASASADWRISSNQAVASPFGGGTWAAAYVDSGMTHNDFMVTITTLSSGEMNLATVKPDGTQRCGVQVTGPAIHLIYGQLDASGAYLAVDQFVNVATVPATPFTLRVAMSGSGVLSCWLNGTLQATTLTVDATSMITYGTSTLIGMLDIGNGHWDDFMTTDGVTVVDHFTRADTTAGLGITSTGQVWNYYP